MAFSGVHFGGKLSNLGGNPPPGAVPAKKGSLFDYKPLSLTGILNKPFCVSPCAASSKCDDL